MIYRQAPEKETVDATITLTTEEYKEAILQYLVNYKMLPDGIETKNVRVSENDRNGSKIRPTITYTKEVLKLYP